MTARLQEVIICGTGPAAQEAWRALNELCIAVVAFLAVPWEGGAEASPLGSSVLPLENLAQWSALAPKAPILVVSSKPRKALKLLRQLTPERLVLHGFAELLHRLEADLASRHPALFAPKPDPDNRRMFNYNRGLLPNKLLALFEEGVTNIDEAFPRSGLSIGYPGWNLLYYACLCSLRPAQYNYILETGTNVGCSTIVLAQALKDSGYRGSVASVDLDSEILQTADENLERAGLRHLVDLHQGDSVAFLSDFTCVNACISLAFLDGCHEKDHVFNEFKAVHPLLDAHSLVFFDNVDELDGVAGALLRIQKTYGGNVVHFENTSWHPPGQAVWQQFGLAGL